jgi:hypothetical protein
MRFIAGNGWRMLKVGLVFVPATWHSSMSLQQSDGFRIRGFEQPKRLALEFFRSGV